MSRVFPGCLKEFQRCIKVVSRIFKGCFKENKGVIKGFLKQVKASKEILMLQRGISSKFHSF